MMEKFDMQIPVLLELKMKTPMHKHYHTNMAILKEFAISTSHFKQTNVKLSCVVTTPSHITDVAKIKMKNCMLKG